MERLDSKGMSGSFNYGMWESHVKDYKGLGDK